MQHSLTDYLIVPALLVMFLALMLAGCGDDAITLSGGGQSNTESCCQQDGHHDHNDEEDNDDDETEESDQGRCEAAGGTWRDATEEEIEAGEDIDGQSCSDGVGGTIEL